MQFIQRTYGYRGSQATQSTDEASQPGGVHLQSQQLQSHQLSNNNSVDQLPQPYEMILSNKQDREQSNQQQISQSVNYSLDQQNMIQDDGNGQRSPSPGRQDSNSKGGTIQIRNGRLGKNPSYGRIRAQANSQAQVSHIAELQQPVKIKNGGQNSGLGLYYKNQRPSHNVNSFQLRGSVGQRNNAAVLGTAGRSLAGSQQVAAANMGAQPDMRLQPNPYIPKRNYALNYSVNPTGGSLGSLNSAGHLVNIKGAGGGANLRDQFTKQRIINQ